MIDLSKIKRNLKRMAKQEKELSGKILKEKKPIKKEDLAASLGVGVDVVVNVIDALREQGYVFDNSAEYIVRGINPNPSSNFDLTKVFRDKFLRFGIVSDTHLGSKKERVDALVAAYDIFKKEGVEQVFHAGDISEGFGVYRGQEYEVKVFGQQEQIDYVVAKYPRIKGIDTYFITGNHDLRQYERGGVDPGTQISKQRLDLKYLGQVDAELNLTEKIKMEILHPGGNTAYALSYKAQRDINNRNADSLPNILVYGHYHTSFSMHYRGVDFLQAPCMKDAGLFEKKLGLNPTIGFWIVECKLSSDREKVERFKPELFTFGKHERTS